MGGFWEREGGGGGCEEAVLVVHPVLGQDSGQEVKTRSPVESCKYWEVGGPKILNYIKFLDLPL